MMTLWQRLVYHLTRIDNMEFTTLSPEQQEFVRVAYEKTGYTEGLAQIKTEEFDVEQTASALEDSLKDLENNMEL